MKKKTLEDKAIEAISAVHSDQSITLEETLYSLEVLRDWVDDCISAIEEDISRDLQEAD